jgi:hypothetical protein
MMLAGLPVPNDAAQELADLVRDADDDLADRLERALDTEVKLLALTLDERALMVSALAQELAELRAVLLADPQPQRRPGCPLSRSQTCVETTISRAVARLFAAAERKPGRRPRRHGSFLLGGDATAHAQIPDSWCPRN